MKLVCNLIGFIKSGSSYKTDKYIMYTHKQTRRWGIYSVLCVRVCVW